jgi:hypothetical protein
MRPALALAAALVALPAAAVLADTIAERGEARLAHLLGDRVAGQPVSCFKTDSGTKWFYIDGVALVYDAGPVIYVGRPTNKIDPRDTILHAHASGRDVVCATDRFYTRGRQSGLYTGVADIREFVPYARD